MRSLPSPSTLPPQELARFELLKAGPYPVSLKAPEFRILGRVKKTAVEVRVPFDGALPVTVRPAGGASTSARALSDEERVALGQVVKVLFEDPARIATVRHHAPGVLPMMRRVLERL